MRHITTNEDHEIFLFDSMTEVIEYSDQRFYSVDTKSAGFVGERLPTFKSAEKRSKRDWAEGMCVLQQYTDRLLKERLPELKSHKRQVRFSEDQGDEIDYDRLRAGQPYWRTVEREVTEGPTEVTIVIDTSTEAYRSSHDILWRGAAALALAKILEEKGYVTEIWVTNGTRLYQRNRTPVMTACCLKRCSDPLDVSTLINTVAGWFYRTFTFCLLRTICRDQGEKPALGLGPVYLSNATDLDHITPDELRVFSAGVYTFDGAFNVVRDELQKLHERDER